MIYEPVQVFEGDGVDRTILRNSRESSAFINIQKRIEIETNKLMVFDTILNDNNSFFDLVNGFLVFYGKHRAMIRIKIHTVTEQFCGFNIELKLLAMIGDIYCTEIGTLSHAGGTEWVINVAGDCKEKYGIFPNFLTKSVNSKNEWIKVFASPESYIKVDYVVEK